MAKDIMFGVFCIVLGIFLVVANSTLASIFRALGTPYPEVIQRGGFLLLGSASIIYGIKAIIVILIR